MTRCSPVLNTPNGVAVDNATLPFWKKPFNTLLNRQAPPVPKLEHVQQTTGNEDQRESTDRVGGSCVYPKMNNGKSSGDVINSAEILKTLPPPGISEMTSII
ncbi:hypothetical protein RB195_020266 [Necator americanus]|uniref:Uncharacterized protein n=1 Tax=Necator americanus TaxID=51031 RepID=A0ABR1CI02_NECAM